jgi:hypothetical protein
MSHQEIQEEHLTHEELKYREHTQRGADFCKIDLFRSAREEYKAALKYRPGDEFSIAKVAECQSYINSDRKKVLIIVPIVLIIVATVIILNF